MMSSANWEGSAMGYGTVETLSDDVLRQMASSTLTRYSRGSTGQRTSGSMRIVKPTSASNSPRGSIGLGRRRTVMDGTYRRRPSILEPNTGTPGGHISGDGLPPTNKPNRPVSWHPSSHLAPQPHYYPAPPVPNSNEFRIFDFPQTPAVCSGYASPASPFSPLSMPFTGYDQQRQPYSEANTSYPSNPIYAINQASSLAQQSQNYNAPSSENMDPSMYSHFDWSNFATNGFENSTTAPPTPENFLPIQHPDPSFPAEEAIPYHPLSDTEAEDDEILVGMGLYDNPEVVKAPGSDLQLDNYRALMMSQLLGPGYKQNEPTGKGLKLEETWNPPASDDEEEDDDEEEKDGEGEDDDELPVTHTKIICEHSARNTASPTKTENSHLSNVGVNFPNQMQPMVTTHHYDHNGWL